MDNSKRVELQDRLTTLSGEQLQFDQEALQALPLHETEKSSLMIKILSALGGFFGSMAFVGFLFMGGLYNSDLSLVIAGFIFMIIGIIIPRLSKKIVWDTVSASLYLIGFFSLMYGADVLDLSTNAFLALCVLIALLTIAIARSYLLTFLSTLAIIGLGVLWMFENDVNHYLHPYIILYSILIGYMFLDEARLVLLGSYGITLYYPIRTGLLFGLLFLMFIGDSFLEYVPIQQDISWSSSVIIIIMIGILFYRVTNLLEVPHLWQRLLLSLLICCMLAPTLYYVPLAYSLLVLLLSFYSNYKTGLVLGLISFIYFMSKFYYDLHYTLLHKSLLLFGTGLFFLLVYLLFFKKLRTHE